jgi:hypothetical protein
MLHFILGSHFKMSLLRHSLRPVFVLAKIFAAYPTNKKSHVAYGFIFTLLLIGFNLNAIKNDIKDSFNKNNDNEIGTQVAVRILQNTILITNFVAMFAFMCFQSKLFKFIIQTLEYQCSVLKCDSDFYTNNTRAMLIYYFFLLLFVIMLIFESFAWKFTITRTLFLFFLLYMAHLSFISFEMLFTSILEVQKNLFGIINRKIQVYNFIIT